MLDTCVRVVRSLSAERRGDLLVRAALAEQPQDVELARRERLGRRGGRSVDIRRRATAGSSWTSPRWAARIAAVTSSASASLSR